MKIGIYFCNCGTNISEKIDAKVVTAAVHDFPERPYVVTVNFICSEDGKAAFEASLIEEQPERVIVAACSPREHETTFRRCLAAVGMNPYLLQMVNLREQIAWVTADPQEATAKAIQALRGAIGRVQLQQPLTPQELESCGDALVIGAGPAGMKAALALAEAGRSVVLVERNPFIGGLPVRFEELFPALECAPCLLEPMMGELLHGEHAERIELLTMAEVVEVTGFYGNFNVKIRQQPRYVDLATCIGCGECVEVCPATLANSFNCNASPRKAIDFPFAGALPNAPFLVEESCLRSRGEECRACKDACPMGEEVVALDASATFSERRVGAIILASGSGLYDVTRIPGLGGGDLPELYDALAFERILSSTGPTGGEIRTRSGEAPTSVAIVHCVASLEAERQPYCSGICCQYAFKFNHLITAKLPETQITHYHREIVAPGKAAHTLMQHALHNRNTTLRRYAGEHDLTLTAAAGQVCIDAGGEEAHYDMVVLCPAITPDGGARDLAALLDIGRDPFGFFAALHGRTDAAQSTAKGIYLAGSCQEPMDIRSSILTGMAAAGYALSGLQPGRSIEIEPTTAEIDAERCAGCRLCSSVCPYRAITFDPELKVSRVNAVLCHGCGTCAAACPAGAIAAHHFTNAQILAEIEGVLK